MDTYRELRLEGRAECERLAVVRHTVAARLVDRELGGEAFTCPRAEEADVAT